MSRNPSASKKKKYDDKTCFLCGGGTFEEGYWGLLREGRSYGILFCGSCGLGKTDPFLGENELGSIYSSTYREGDSTRFSGPIERLIRAFRVQRCLRVERFLKDKGRILDVGCGRGDFLALMAARGWKAHGLELDSRIEAHGKKMGLDLAAGSIEDAFFPDGYFDAVTFWHVFEHVRRPMKALGVCRRILKPGGLLVIAVPNAGSMQARAAGRHWFHLDPPYHLYHYSSVNLERLLEKEGFEVERVSHFSLEYNPYGWLQSIYNACGLRPNHLYDLLRGKGAKGRLDFLNVMAMLLMMPVLLPLSMVLSIAEAAAGHGGTMEVYARKKGA